MRSYILLTAIYAILVITLGILGYQQAGSVISLVMGLIFGVILLFSAFYMTQEKKWAFILGILASSILLISFGYRFGITLGFMPGAMSLFSGIIIAGLLLSVSKLMHR